MRYAQIRSLDISNGEGIGVSLFVQGCHFRCNGCFNQETWDFNGGKEWTKKTENEFIKLVNRPHVQRVSILGGEPLAKENCESVFDLILNIKSKYPYKKIWIYTGYTLESFLHSNKIEDAIKLSIVSLCDILVDGKFVDELKDPLNQKIKYAGSTNQRIIDIQRTLTEKKVITYGE